MTGKIETLSGNPVQCHFILSPTNFRTSRAAWGCIPEGTVLLQPNAGNSAQQFRMWRINSSQSITSTFTSLARLFLVCFCYFIRKDWFMVLSWTCVCVCVPLIFVELKEFHETRHEYNVTRCRPQLCILKFLPSLFTRTSEMAAAAAPLQHSQSSCVHESSTNMHLLFWCFVLQHSKQTRGSSVKCISLAFGLMTVPIEHCYQF